jgi:hypothetical protein
MEFPIDVPLPIAFDYKSDLPTRRYNGILDHEIDFLCKEIIINGKLVSNKSLKDRNNLSSVVNYLRMNLVDVVEKENKKNNHDFLIEFNRIVHQQFQWQHEYGSKVIMRYYKIFSSKKLNELITSVLGISVFQLYLLGIFYSGICFRHFFNIYPIKSQIDFISNDMLNFFLESYSSTLEELRTKMVQYQEINDKIFYAYNPLIEKPIIRNSFDFFSPIPVLIIWQITNGTYYKILNQKGFENAFGESFESYTGEVIRKILNSRKDITLVNETSYDKGGKKTSDWIVYTDDCIVFIECKTKRMRFDSKFETNISISLDGDLEKMASFVVQIYKTYLDYSNNKYDNISYNNNRKFVPLVITLEDWYVNFNHKLKKIIHEKIIALFEIEIIPLSLLDDFPYFIRSMADFESSFQFACEIGLRNYFDKVEKNQLQELSKKFKYKELFLDEYKHIFFNPIHDTKIQ